ncbi:UDP-N-acetyl-D-mannosaminuronate dehydrogenase [Geosmithia morbida]|uniref:UDP-N-acetyl-D-mannosaminuronate dehydrogenase n=1 Tax=Geosmithia morbida TaxID=1094350 RepID=A0A9P4YQ87_9HYPO|nr:UDP-N-acetyl-D-mannosaminuronate dehydrogenase [Geosmithia morbida]KAF4119728.1 UDP-N-acetyl-D-mannosaminuronate dehydrogenase [Geosmithia morbida]
MSQVMTAQRPGPKGQKPGPIIAPAPGAGGDFPWSSAADPGFYPDTPPITEDDYLHRHRLKESSSAESFSLEPVRPEDEPVIAVLGVGYVGTHLVESFSKRYGVIGFDVSRARVRQLREEHGGVGIAGKALDFTDETVKLSAATHFLISVPTLLRPDRTIDSSYLREAVMTVAQVARRGSTVVVESSVAVGMTRQILGPIISGLDDVIPGSLDAIHRVYSSIFDNVVTVSKPEVAEMMKLYENCQRMVCIAYANEMADACAPHGIDPYEVCAAAATKPFGYMPYTPGIGVGGHCIPVNPFYLLSNSSFPLLEAATASMWDRPAKIAERALESFRDGGEAAAPAARRPRVLVVGMAFKAGQESLSNSPGIGVAKHLAISGEVDVQWADALVPQEAIPQIPRLADADWNRDVLQTFDLVIVALQQHKMDFGLLNQLDGVRVEKWCR